MNGEAVNPIEEYKAKQKELQKAREERDEKAIDELTHALEHLWWKLDDEEQEQVNQ